MAADADVTGGGARLAVRLVLMGMGIGTCLGFAAGFKVAEEIYADDRERKRLANTVKLTVATAGVTAGILLVTRVAFAVTSSR